MTINSHDNQRRWSNADTLNLQIKQKPLYCFRLEKCQMTHKHRIWETQPRGCSTDVLMIMICTRETLYQQRGCKTAKRTLERRNVDKNICMSFMANGNRNLFVRYWTESLSKWSENERESLFSSETKQTEEQRKLSLSLSLSLKQDMRHVGTKHTLLLGKRPKSSLADAIKRRNKFWQN